MYLSTVVPLVFDPYDRNRGTGSFILIDEITRETAGGGVIVRARGPASLAADPRRRVAARGAIVWFTGLPGSGKTTIAARVCARLSASGIDIEHLDGDEFRTTFSWDLGFSPEDRTKNIERAAQVAGLLVKHRVVVLAAFVSPARLHRALVRMAAPDVFEVFVNAPLDVCIERDPKGMYREAKAGGRPLFTGVGDSYEPPEHPELELRTDQISIDDAASAVLQMLIDRGISVSQDEKTPLVAEALGSGRNEKVHDDPLAAVREDQPVAPEEGRRRLPVKRAAVGVPRRTDSRKPDSNR